MYSTQAATRTGHDGRTTSQATTGATAIRAAVIALGRFTWTALRWTSVAAAHGALGERLQHQLADCFQRVEHSVAADRDSLEIRRALDPFASGNLLDQVLAGVVWIGCHA